MRRPHAIALAAVLLAAGGCARRTPTEPAGGGNAFTVMTYNINYGMAGDAKTIEAVKRGNADIVLLQETTDEWEEALRSELGGMYPHMAFRHCCGAGGLGIMSRYAFEEEDYIPSPSGWFPAWRFTVESPFGPLQMLNIHLHPPVGKGGGIVSGYFTTPGVRLEEIESYFDSVEPGLPTVIAGDFNERKGGRAVGFLEKKGFSSVLPEFHPGTHTWRWNTSAGEVTWQLDHIMYNSRLRALEARVIELGSSDHMPVVASFEPAG